jgi:uncharacterized membrane protein YsdA (DUF1294 family)
MGACHLIFINAINFYTMGYDKKQAKRGLRRIPEQRLFTFAAIGGALGGWLGMLAWRHKTKHLSFIFGFPALLFVNILCVYLLLFLLGNI